METQEFPAEELVVNKIFYIRGQKVMLDRDLAELYGVPTKVLKQSVKRNALRFPPDFMFELSQEEFSNLRSQIVTSSWGGARYLPMAFTEQGVAMLSSILHSDRAILVNIQIVRVFTRIRKVLADTTELRLALEQIRRKTDNNTRNIELVFQYLDELIGEKEKEPKEPTQRATIGYKT